MAPQRNVPCPCGSGRKYKQCCGSPAALAAEVASGREELRRVAAAAEFWEVDAFPLMISFREEAALRPVALLVTAGDLVVHHDILPSLSGEYEDVARALEEAFAAAAREVGAHPRRVRVRHAEVADALRSRLDPHRVAVELVQALPSVEEAARALLLEVTGDAVWPPACETETWSGWGLPRALLSELFAAAGAFWTTACWRSISNLQAPVARLPSGRQWTVSVMGNAGQQFGLALYSDGGDLYERVAGDDDYPFALIQGCILGLTFDPASRVAREAVEEVRLARLKLASPSAFPSLMTVNTPGGGVSRGQIQDLICLLQALPAFVQAHAGTLEREEHTGRPCAPIEWTHAETGVALSYAGEAFKLPLPWQTGEGGDGTALPPELIGLLDEALSTAFADGTLDLDDGQDPGAALSALNARVQGPTEVFNNTAQAELGGLSPAQVHRLLQSDWSGEGATVRLRRDLPGEALAASALLSRSRTLLEFAVERGSLGATQAGNLQLDVVLELSDRMSVGADRVRLHRTRGKRLREQDIWPLHETRIVAEVAGLLTPLSRKFVPTDLARTLLDPAREGELYALLFETIFQRLNRAYGLPLQWPELQMQSAFTLYRLGPVAKRWRAADELVAEVVLPFALERAPRPDGQDARARLFEAMLLEPLVDAALIERKLDGTEGARGRDGAARYRAAPLLARFLTFDLG